jgi:hypothetical protein
MQDRAPPSLPASLAQESLVAFQAVGHDVLILPNKAVAPPPLPAMLPSSPPAVESADDIQHVSITAHGDKAKARDLLAAIWTLKALEAAQRPATPDERQARAGFPGFGIVVLGILPDPVSGRSKDAGWQQLGGVSP